MALQSSGQISLDDIHVEAGGTSGTEAQVNDADIRGLIGASSAAEIEFADFYGASSAAEFKFAVAYDEINDHDDITYNFTNQTPAIEAGDLIVVAVSSDYDLTGAPTGPSQFINADAISSSGISYPGHYVEYAFYTASMGTSFNFNGSPVGYGIAACAAVFKNAGNSLLNSSSRYRSSGLPDPDNLPAYSGSKQTKLIVLTGHLDDDRAAFAAPSGYTVARSNEYSYGGYTASTVIAYKITNSNAADDAGAFTNVFSGFGSGNSDANYAYAFRFGA